MTNWPPESSWGAHPRHCATYVLKHIERLEGVHRNLHLVHLPVRASWLSQIEIYFSTTLEREVLTPPDAASLDELAERILAFQAD